MEEMHSLLRRQLKRYFSNELPDAPSWREFLCAVSDVYRDFDVQRELNERSLVLSSEELYQANAEMRAIFQAMPDLLFRLDDQGTILDFKAGTADDLLRPAQELIGKKIQSLPFRQIGRQFKEAIRQVVAKKLPVTIEYSLTLQSRKNFYEARLVPLSKNQIVVIIRNVTARKRMEDELLTSQALYHSFVEHLPASVFRKDYEGRYVFVNTMFCRLKNLTPEQVLGKTPAELAAYESSCRSAGLIPPARQATRIQGEDHHELILRTGKSIELEEAYLQPDGTTEYFHVVKSPVFGPDGQVIGSQGIQFDITARKRAEEELFKSQQMLRAILDTIPTRIFWKDRNGVYLGCNKPLAKDCGFSDPDQIIGKTDFDITSTEMAERYHADDRQVMESGQPKLNYEEPQRDVNGGQKTLFTSKAPLYDKDGRVIGILGSYEDITERKRLEEQLRQVQKMEAVGQLSGGIAHDFNNILTIIQGHVSLMEFSAALTSELRDSITEIRQASARAANLTRQLLAFSRRQRMHAVTFDLNEVVSNMTRMLQRIVGEDVAIQIECAPRPAMIHADVSMVEQVLMNLVVNSRDAMPKGGQLVIQTAIVEINPFVAALSPQARSGNFVCLTVSDSGAGIPPEVMPRIFEPFFTTKGVGKGTGLGLATVYGIVQQHQGWINVESGVGKGTTFRIYLPYSEKTSQQEAEPETQPATPGGKETILLAEDEPAVRALVNNALAKLGYRVLQARNGVQAMEIWKQHRDEIQLLLTDMVMPDGVNGRELSERLRQEKPGLKVIYASGYSADVVGLDFPLEEGVNFLAKPFNPLKLAQIVRARLDA
ncbi:MAG TPA: PAS domain-containing protein [Candidatus Aquilonibacter sp.]|nr:PAS domain-containing protein [Candidatus Aquilonibacter sp.]